jgi:hypothetical protein
MIRRRLVVESPLAGDTVRNFRFLLWCLRALWKQDGTYGLASHLINPWFMNDADSAERKAGIDNPWVWDPAIPHIRFMDLGESYGMKLAKERCDFALPKIPCGDARLSDFCPESWAAFQRGEWPPHTDGFELTRAYELSAADIIQIEADLKNEPGVKVGLPIVVSERIKS